MKKFYFEDCGECEEDIYYELKEVENGELTCSTCGSKQLPCATCIIVNKLEFNIDVSCKGDECLDSRLRMLDILRQTEKEPERFRNKSYGISAK